MEKNKNITSEGIDQDSEGRKFIEDLKHFGYLPPTNDEELEEFTKIFGSTPVMFPDHLNNADFLFNKKSAKDNLRVGNESKPAECKNESVSEAAPVKSLETKPYFKNLVFAAEITSQLYSENTFGHKKFFKIYYICDQICDLRLEMNCRKFVAGPYDQELMTAIDAGFSNKKWFSVSNTGHNGYRYLPEKNCDDYKQFYVTYFGAVQESVNRIINLFRKKDSEFCEKVATLFAVWKEQLLKKNKIDQTLLIEKFYQWSKEKKKFTRAELIESIVWMEQNRVAPVA